MEQGNIITKPIVQPVKPKRKSSVYLQKTKNKKIGEYNYEIDSTAGGRCLSFPGNRLLEERGDQVLGPAGVVCGADGNPEQWRHSKTRLHANNLNKTESDEHQAGSRVSSVTSALPLKACRTRTNGINRKSPDPCALCVCVCVSSRAPVGTLEAIQLAQRATR